MTRRSAQIAGAAVAAFGAVGLALLGAGLAGERRADRELYERAFAAQRRAVARPAPASERDRQARAAPETVCVRGVETVAAAAARALGAELTRDGLLDPSALRQVSGAAVAGERYAEQAAGGPALPQRLGRRRTRENGAWTWAALEPETVACAGSRAFARFPAPPWIDARPAE